MRACEILRNTCLLALGVFPFAVANATFYPNYGFLCYDGATYGYAYKYWTSTPGPWTGNGPGYEHDLVLNNVTFFSGCNSWTNLPAGYDDCPTVGVLEDPGERVFSWGTFDATQKVR